MYVSIVGQRTTGVMLVLTILVIMVATEEDQKMINMYNCEESYKNESSC